jgi:outer membrane protein assembly factor BamA
MNFRLTIFNILTFSLFIVLFFSSCNSTKHLSENQYLLRKNSININTNNRFLKKSDLIDQLQSFIIQKPNSYFPSIGLGISFPVKLYLYNFRYKKYAKDSNSLFIKNRIVEKPVIFDSSLKNKSKSNIAKYLYNNGYFYANISDSTYFRNQKAYVHYNIETGKKYQINQFAFDIDDTSIAKIIANNVNLFPIQPNKDFSMSLLDEQRSFITNLLRNNGYFFFTNSNISFLLDTLQIDSKTKKRENLLFKSLNITSADKNYPINISLIVRNNDDPRSYTTYSIGDIKVYMDFESNADFTDSSLFHIEYENIHFYYHNYYVNKNVIHKHLFLDKGTYFKQDNYDQTINKLNDLGVFKYIRIFIDADTSKGNRNLNCTIVLSPTQKYDLSFNVELSNATTYSLGSALNFNIKNRNVLKGANLLSANLTGGYEYSYNNNLSPKFLEKFYLLSRNISGNINFILPKFILPFPIKGASKSNQPTTTLTIGSSLQDRINYFKLNNTVFSINYNWHETEKKQWNVVPAFMNFVSLPYTSDSFKNRLATNSFLERSYQEAFIEGERINFIYSNQIRNKKTDLFYLKLGIEEAGGLVSGLSKLGVLNKDLKFAQYVKFDLEAIKYINYKKSMWAFRSIMGVGMPYGNSSTLPYIKQYFVGGPYSLRGWRARQLGPGAYVSFDSTNAQFIDRTGDIKFECNAEYRYDILQLFGGTIKMNGAIFTDAGNIWMSRSSEKPNTQFLFSQAFNNLAISSGTGIRLDFAGFVILRFDAAFPIKQASPNTLNTWQIKNIDIFNPTWRANNLIFNFAIGYPF